jgi:hypothetical protein
MVGGHNKYLRPMEQRGDIVRPPHEPDPIRQQPEIACQRLEFRPHWTISDQKTTHFRITLSHIGQRSQETILPFLANQSAHSNDSWANFGSLRICRGDLPIESC